jgi:hypothetical protein
LEDIDERVWIQYSQTLLGAKAGCPKPEMRDKGVVAPSCPMDFRPALAIPLPAGGCGALAARFTHTKLLVVLDVGNEGGAAILMGYPAGHGFIAGFLLPEQ